VPAPSRITLRKDKRALLVEFGQGRQYELGAEYLRVYSPSAEVQGHGPGQETLVLNKQSVKILTLEAQGNYAIRIHFDDHHNSGIYSWNYLEQLGKEYEQRWADYQKRVKDSESGQVSAIKWMEP
jgi:DUF971 family protein